MRSVLSAPQQQIWVLSVDDVVLLVQPVVEQPPHIETALPHAPEFARAQALGAGLDIDADKLVLH